MHKREAQIIQERGAEGSDKDMDIAFNEVLSMPLTLHNSHVKARAV